MYFHDVCSDRKQIDSVYLDFSKAFDSVLHTQLLLRMRSVGIIGSIWSWYLSGHSQYVLVNNCLSKPLPVRSDVTQDSILVSLLLIVYINDTSERVKNSIIFKFADNLKSLEVIYSFVDSSLLWIPYMVGALTMSFLSAPRNVLYYILRPIQMWLKIIPSMELRQLMSQNME